MPITKKTESDYSENNITRIDSKLMDNSVDSNKDSFTKSKRKVRFNSFSKKDEKSRQNSIVFKNYFGDSFEEGADDSEKDNNIRTENIIAHEETSRKEKEYNPNDYSIVLNLSQDKILFNNIQYDSMFIHDIDPFKEESVQKVQNNTNFNILDELKDEEKKENIVNNSNNNNNSNENKFSEKSPNDNKSLKKDEKGGKNKRNSVKFDEKQLSLNKKSTKSKKGKKNNRKNKGNDSSRELLKNKFLKFIKKYASNSKNYSLSDDVEIEKSFYNFYDENFGKNGIDFDASICTYEKHDGSKYNVTVNDLFDDRNEFDEFKNSIYINNDEYDDTATQSTIKASRKKNSSFQYNSSFVYDHNSFGPDYEDTMNYLFYNISTCIDNEDIMDDEEKNKKLNENILSRLYDEENTTTNNTNNNSNNNTKDINNNINSNNNGNETFDKEDKLKVNTLNKGKTSENSKLKENLKTFMESEAFKNVIKNPDTFTIFLKSILMGYIDPKKIDDIKDKLFKMIDNQEIEQIKKFVNDYVDIVEESEDKIKDIKEKSIMIENNKDSPSTDIIEQNPGFIARFNDIMIEKFTNINNAIINFTSAMCPQIIKNGFNNIVKSIPFIVSFASLIPTEYITGLLSSFPAGQNILNAVNDVIMKSSFLSSSHLVLPQIAIIIGCLYKNFTRNSETNSRGINEDNSNSYLSKFMGLFEIFSRHLRNDGGLNDTGKDPSLITSKVVNAIFKTMVESKDLPPLFKNDKVNTVVTNLMNDLPSSENKLKSFLGVLNDVMNDDNETSKELFEELINLLDREKLDDEDFSKILSLIIKGSQNLANRQNEIEANAEENVNASLSTMSLNESNNNYNDSSIDLDKSYSVNMLIKVLEELKKSKGETDFYKEPIHEYKKMNESLNPNRKVKMKYAYEKRSYSLADLGKNNLHERDNNYEFSIRKQNTTDNNVEFLIGRNEHKFDKEQIIPKYYPSSSVSPTVSPVNVQRKNKSYDERRLNRGFSDNNVIKSSEKLYNMEKNNGFHNLYMRNEWNDEEIDKSGKKNKDKDFFLETKGINIGDSLINDDCFIGYNKEKNNEVRTEENKVLTEDPNKSKSTYNDFDNNSTITEKHRYSINSDDTYDRIFFLNNKSNSDDSFNSIKGNSDKSKKSKKSKDQSFTQKLMRRFSRNESKKSNKAPVYIEWENLPLEIIFNIFKNFSTQELAKLRLVSKHFNYILTNPIFYMNINLTNESDTINNEMLMYQWRYSNGYLLSLNLSQCNLINENVFKEAIDYKIKDRKINNKVINERETLCFNNSSSKFENEESLVQNLRNLDLSYCNGIYSSEIMCNFFKGISIQPNGDIIKKNGCINLEELNLSDLYQILDDDILLSIADSCPKLKKLYISKGYDITNYSIKMILRKCKHLELLKLVNCPKINYEAFDTRNIEEISILSDNINNDLNLKYLNVSYCRMMEDNFVKMISNNCPFLEELHISGCQNISDEGLKYLVSGRAWNNQRVKVLDISGCYCIGDNGIKTITPSVLEKLDISNCSFITDFGLKSIHDGMPLLKEIGYENCSGTSSNGRDKLLSKYEILTKTE